MAPTLRLGLAAALVATGVLGVARAAEEAASASATPTATPPLAIVELTEDTFKGVVSGETPVLVEFYAPWCGYCRSVKAEVERAAELAKARGLPLIVARIDAPKADDLAGDYGVQSLPTFFLFGSQGHIRFPTLSTAEAMLAGAGKLLGVDMGVAPVKSFTGSTDELLSWLFWRGAGDGTVHTTAVLFTPPGLAGAAAAEAAGLRAAFEEAAGDLLRFSNLRFASVDSAAPIADFELPADRAVVAVYMDHDEGRALFDGPADAAAIRSFVLRHDVPLVTTVTHRNLQSARKRVETLALFFIEGRQGANAPTLARLKKGLGEAVRVLVSEGRVARGNFTVGLVDGTKYKDWLREYGLPLNKLPALAVEHTPTGRLYAAGDLTEVSAANPPADWEATAAAAAAAEASSEEGAPAAEPLPWVDVPVGDVIGFLSAVADGAVAPVKTLAKRAAPTPTPTPLAPVLGSAQSGHAEEL